MTYCLAIKVREGIIGLADTRLTSGNEFSVAKKVTVHQHGQKNALFIMTSGLRSVRDKAITYFNEAIEQSGQTYGKLYRAVNALADQLRRVAQEDKAALYDSGLRFNLYAIVGGQLAEDTEPKLYLLYPEGNWVEVGETSPFFIIGNSGYGRPILVRTIDYHDTSLPFAVKAGFMSFDATRLCCNDVDYPVDVVMYERDSYLITEHRFHRKDFEDISDQWNQDLIGSIHRMPDAWMTPMMDKWEAEQKARALAHAHGVAP
jgi:putative proteasome-type protease